MDRCTWALVRLARGHRKAGLAIGVVGFAWTVVAVRVVVPAFSGGADRFYGFYEGVGGSPRGLVTTAFTDPLAILGELFDPNVLVFLVAFAVPLGGLFFLARALAAVVLPQLALNALADPRRPHRSAAALSWGDRSVLVRCDGVGDRTTTAGGTPPRGGSASWPRARHDRRVRAARRRA